jgi:hypothetical protein
MIEMAETILAKRIDDDDVVLWMTVWSAADRITYGNGENMEAIKGITAQFREYLENTAD